MRTGKINWGEFLKYFSGALSRPGAISAPPDMVANKQGGTHHRGHADHVSKDIDGYMRSICSQWRAIRQACQVPARLLLLPRALSQARSLSLSRSSLALSLAVSRCLSLSLSLFLSRSVSDSLEGLLARALSAKWDMPSPQPTKSQEQRHTANEREAVVQNFPLLAGRAIVGLAVPVGWSAIGGVASL